MSSIAAGLPAQQAAAPAAPPVVLVECLPASLNRIYRAYFTAAVIILLTAGASWGGWLLWRIGIVGKFAGGVSVQDVNAHGHAQIYGWMGLFIMGFGYHVLPRFWRAPLAAPRLTRLVFALIVTGIAVRTLGMTTQGVWHLAVPAAMAGCILEVAACFTFAAQMVFTFTRGKTPFRPESALILAAMFWFASMSLFDAFHTWFTMTAAADRLLWYVSTYQAPLRDMQVHGLALFMILGISAKMVPSFYGRSVPPGRRGWIAVMLLCAAVIGEVGVFLAYRWTGLHVIAAFLMLPWLMLAAGAALIVWPWKLWQSPPRYHRSNKFIRAAYAWLALSLLMLLALPLYQAAVRIPFSHAYYGAIRHAMTVGFVSLMILGMSSRFVPAMAGIPSSRGSGLWGPFVLVNLGCAARVLLQILTDWNHGAYAVVGVSALLELTGLAWWAIDLLRTMWSARNDSPSKAAAHVLPNR